MAEPDMRLSEEKQVLWVGLRNPYQTGEELGTIRDPFSWGLRLG
jgi:hypothetical protein